MSPRCHPPRAILMAQIPRLVRLNGLPAASTVHAPRAHPRSPRLPQPPMRPPVSQRVLRRILRPRPPVLQAVAVVRTLRDEVAVTTRLRALPIAAHRTQPCRAGAHSMWLAETAAKG